VGYPLWKFFQRGTSWPISFASGKFSLNEYSGKLSVYAAISKLIGWQVKAGSLWLPDHTDQPVSGWFNYS